MPPKKRLHCAQTICHLQNWWPAAACRLPQKKYGITCTSGMLVQGTCSSLIGKKDPLPPIPPVGMSVPEPPHLLLFFGLVLPPLPPCTVQGTLVSPHLHGEVQSAVGPPVRCGIRRCLPWVLEVCGLSASLRSPRSFVVVPGFPA